MKKPPQKHVCRKNWQGSAKGMEPDMLVDMLKNSESSKAHVGCIVGDDDTTGIYKARLEVNKDLKKFSDKNHVRKNVTKQLYSIKKSHKELTVKVISAITKNFNYMLDQNKCDVLGIERGLKSMVGHVFGDHQHCLESWCGFLKSPNTYKHTNITKDLTSQSLKDNLNKLFVCELSLQSEKLAYLGSSQANESLNNIIASKAPKSKHFSESSSLNYRVCAAICQKNEGHTYLAEVDTIDKMFVLKVLSQFICSYFVLLKILFLILFDLLYFRILD